MLAQERYEQTLSILNREGSVKVSKLTKLFNVSIETIRRDLEYLEKEGLLKRVYGGAVLKKIDNNQLKFENREKEFSSEKKEIANIATRYVVEGQSLAMDASTTNLEIAKVLKTKFKKLTILTNSLAIANELIDMDKYTIILTGGILKNDEFSLVGDIAQKYIESFNIHTAFISVSGVSLKEGLTDYILDHLQIQKKFIEISQNVIVLADSSKFDSVSLLNVCNLEDVNMIITDSRIKKNVLEKYLNNGIEVINI
ncbi:DeoR/GlpR family DNA-binding transcription regulator [Clostridium tetani]|uniref:DeoR family transcriptional regulator n=1 Tax=Clostridium tetani TaxID=1513 RepID=A0A4Q0VG09_CLOTA|nr:DeoR/GlpR family DNA-binding transcription regulator [Clostridium tetani]CDI49254.1 DeoR family transcriptional regulator [Clostridium tetani 12124569]KGI42643.1 DeoR faimly transcriptional regulator [Clostridium tetani]KHO39454.1 DeoR faimly transcriptional regulator [Clostridium tetani]RXI38787.1 DeoR/GlpR transcriptional regulator [Clostridium tetani]RXI50760.1 DeoR/GlpR transcriptional regulator [Clostridium tetani]